MIQLRDICLSFGPRQIFTDINCIFQASQRIGIIGRNGAGKSMLLKLIAGKIQADSGQINIAKSFKLAYLPQEEVLNSNLNVFAEALSAFKEIFQVKEDLKKIEEIISDKSLTEDQLEEYSELQVKNAFINEHEAERKTTETLNGLGFSQDMLNKKVNELSTGWKMRLALAKLLLTEADIYLFDEPTNHLDIITQEWFLEKLLSMKKGFLLVSHDRVYLEKACDYILEIERSRANYYKGNLQAYLEQKEQQANIAKATRARQEKEIEQKKVIVERFRSSASRAKQAQNLIKQIERIELVEIEPPLPLVSFKFPIPLKPGNIVLSFNNITQEFNSKIIFSSISGEITRGERVALIAANGVGKSTLINCISSKQTPKAGSIKFGHNVKAALFEQDQAQTLDLEKTIFEELCSSCADVPELEIRKILGAFLFSKDDVNKKIKVLSGGEKNRVAMAKLLLQKANLLILDEPTNHLDLYSKDILCQALATYDGTILFVSHDYDFVNRLATRIIELTPTQAISYVGSYQDFCELKKAQFSQKDQNNSIIANQKFSSKIASNSNQQEIKYLKKRITEVEKQITKLERQQTKLSEIMATISYNSQDYIHTAQQLVHIQKELGKIQQEWEELVEQLF